MTKMDKVMPSREQQSFRVLAVSGSLRASSSNTTLLRVMRALAPEGVAFSLYEGIGDLPHFNPELEGEILHPVVRWRAALDAADGLVVCSPEYAHGVPGSLKNALDWVVGSGELMEKPVALLNASSSATHAHAALTETLTVMMAEVVPGASLRVSLGSNKVDETALLYNEAVTGILRASLAALVGAMEARRVATEARA